LKLSSKPIVQDRGSSDFNKFSGALDDKFTLVSGCGQPVDHRYQQHRSANVLAQADNDGISKLPEQSAKHCAGDSDRALCGTRQSYCAEQSNAQAFVLTAHLRLERKSNLPIKGRNLCTSG
jgi:hypothetical protein